LDDVNCDSESVRAGACQWLRQFLDESAFAAIPSSEASPLAISYGVLSLHGLGTLEEALNRRRTDFAEYLRRCQDPSNGYFIDRRSDFLAADSRKNEGEYLDRRVTYFALLALHVLKAKAPHPLGFTKGWRKEDVISWVDELWHSKLSRKGERISHVLLFLIYRMESDGNKDAVALFHTILDWLADKQSEKNGLWEPNGDSGIDEPIMMAGCVLPFFEYVRRPIQRRSRMMDAMIQLFESGRIPHTAQSELSLISALTIVKNQLSYRREEIQSLFVELHKSICRLQRVDGSFADSEPGENLDGESTAAPVIEATFLRLATLAIIEQTLPAEFAQAHWGTQEWPGPGYHPLFSLSEHERKTLRLWLRPTAETSPNVDTELHSQKPQISIVIPCFNLGRYLHEAVESVLMQTYQRLEIIIVDDGSTDEFTAWLLQNFDRPKTTIVRQANAGLAATRNRGIARASGRYVCCLDPDDRLRPEFFAEAVQVLEREPDVGFVSGYFQMFDERDDTFRYGSCEFPDLLAYNQAIEPAIFRRDAWDRARGYCETFTTSGIEDWDLWISFLELGYRAHVIPEIVWEYRIRPDQMSTAMYEPERWGRVVYELVRRHSESYAKYAPAILAKQASRWAQIRAWANECQRAAAWWENNSRLWQFRAETHGRLMNDRQRWIDTLIVDKQWLEEQRVSWQQLAEEREKLVGEQQRWIDTLKKDQAWLNGQRETWQKLAGEREKLLAEQRVWISELEAAKTWLESELTRWRGLAEQRTASIEEAKNKAR
jgi:glycosyltransferase involved in cell wall biosynthesis